MEVALKSVQNDYPKLYIARQLCPTYVEMYTKIKNEVVLVCTKSKNSLTTCESNGKNNQTESEELDLTGSPLKLDLSLHTVFDDTLISDEPQLWTKEEGNNIPINVDLAREVANLFNKYITDIPMQDVTPIWLLCNPTAEVKPLLLTIQSNEDQFIRGIVTYEDSVTFDDIDVGMLVENFAMQEQISEDMVNLCIDCKYTISGISYGSHSCEELLNAPHGGITELHCEWTSKTLQTPFISCKVNFVIGNIANVAGNIGILPAMETLEILLEMGNLPAGTSLDLDTILCSKSSPIFHIKDDESLCEKNPYKNKCKTYQEDCSTKWYDLNQINTYFYFCCGQCQVKLLCGDQVTSMQLSNAGLITVSQGCILKFKDFTVYTHNQERQEVIIGNLGSPCTTIWKSVCALQKMNQILVDMTAAGQNSIDLNTANIRSYTSTQKIPNNTKRLNELLNQTEIYAYTAEYPTGGCVCINEDTTSLKMCFNEMARNGSSYDFTYQLWDILRDCETAEELITLLIQALKFISSGKIRPFIDVNNKTYLSKLVLKLSRGHSQSAKVLKNLRASPPQALSLVAQVGTEKIMWEYTKIMSLLEHSFFIAAIWTSDTRTHESIEQINQTINDMTMSGGDFTLNPFESLSTNEQSIRLDCESFYEEDPNELTVDDFASLKKHGLVGEKKDVNEVPLISDEIDISPWKNLLMRFAQVHVCLEHLYRAETCLRADFATLKPLASRLLEYYVSEKSPIKTVGQLMCDPLQKTVMPIANNIVMDHLKKPALWYRVELTRKENSYNTGIKRDCKVVHVFSQQTVFPPSVWQSLEPINEENVADVTTIGEELKYHSTKYVYLSNKMKSKLLLSKPNHNEG